MFITGIIIAITCVISIIIFNKPELKMKYTFSPYRAAHYKEWYRSISHMFLHADWMHLGFNMFVLFQFGPMVLDGVGPEGLERGGLIELFGNVGYLYFILIYIGGGLFATLPSMIKHRDNDLYHSLGASGAVFSILFASILMFPSNELGFFFIPIAIPGFVFGPLVLLMEYYMNKRRASNIAHDAHIGGALFGIVFLCILRYEFAVEFFVSMKIWISSFFN